jgi:hypothetical protein
MQLLKSIAVFSMGGMTGTSGMSGVGFNASQPSPRPLGTR